MQADHLRSKYLEFFKNRGHSIIPSSALVPENDPTTLFTGSGMQPMIEYLLGAKHPKGTRIADSQKCFRSQDIEEVGDNRHTTFFEMLGNWSLGDYFKKEQLTWFFEFLTKEVGLDPNKLFVTVFRGNDSLGIGKDAESVAIWKELFAGVGITATDVDFSERDGMQGGRIFYFDEKKNWWSRAGVPANMPEGEPGGPDSEVFYDFGVEKKLHENSVFKDEPCHVNCDCGRFLEIGNSVFMQYQKQADGSFKELAQKNVDFGGGFERILAVKQDTDDVFLTPIFEPIITFLETVSGKQYSDEKVKQSFRVIADHMRAATMLAADGVYPSSKEQGYFARRLVRRAIRYAKMIGIEQPFVAELSKVVANLYSHAYPDVAQNIETVSQGLAIEEKKFANTLQKGLREVEKVEKLTGEVAFKLYETYGFPFELSQEIAKEKGYDLSQEEFDSAKQAHADQSRTASAGKFKGGLQDSSEQTTKYHTATHLLHAALRKILGSHVQQKGSNITAERLRFDFSHPTALTDTEKNAVEAQINEWIQADLPVTVQTMEKKSALESGAIAFFVEKYPDQVTVYTIGNDPETNWISKEFCGGPHVKHTGEIGTIKIEKEKAAAAGIRRVYLV
ncbi:MAG: alanine--tRNA ligase [Patescibacteria group bacterium]|nr:MAG: alanine--tRNA ligase [Patescibacteria group bacterium]